MRLPLFIALLMITLAASPALRTIVKDSLSRTLGPLAFSQLQLNNTRAFSIVKPIYQGQLPMASPILQTPLASVSSNVQPEPMSPATKEELPKLSIDDFRTFNQLAELMEYYHNHFRQMWTTLSTACSTNTRPPGHSIRQFINLGLTFTRQITLHHDIEEAHVFPMLATKMPRFRDQAHMKNQHKQIHAGLERLETYLEACRDGERELRLGELGDIMAGFSGVLWQHLDDEVKELGAENMRLFWTREEMKRLRF